jgi:hypothetical protein
MQSTFLFTPDDVQRAARGHEHEATIRHIFYMEIGRGVTDRQGQVWVPYDPYMPHGDPRCYGPGGLCEYGLLREFTTWSEREYGYADRYDPYQVAAYINWVLANGRKSNWPYLR